MKILGHRVGQKLEIYLNSGTLDNFLTCAACHHCFLASRGATPRCYLRVGCCSAFVLWPLAARAQPLVASFR